MCLCLECAGVKDSVLRARVTRRECRSEAFAALRGGGVDTSASVYDNDGKPHKDSKNTQGPSVSCFASSVTNGQGEPKIEVAAARDRK